MKYNPNFHTQEWYDKLRKAFDNDTEFCQHVKISRKTLNNWKNKWGEEKLPTDSFLLEDITMFITNKKIQQKLDNGVCDEDIDYFLRRAGRHGLRDYRFAKIIIGFVNEYLR